MGKITFEVDTASGAAMIMDIIDQCCPGSDYKLIVHSVLIVKRSRVVGVTRISIETDIHTEASILEMLKRRGWNGSMYIGAQACNSRIQ